MEILFKHFGKFWLVTFVISLLFCIGSIVLMAWAVIKLVNHFTATPAATAFAHSIMPYLS